MNLERRTEEEFLSYGCKSKHDRIVDIVSEELARRDYEVFCEIDYSVPHLSGDYDVIGIKDDYRVIVEAKSTPCDRSLEKALDQLKRARTHSELYAPQKRIFTFYATTTQDNSEVCLTHVYKHELPKHYRGAKWYPGFNEDLETGGV